MFTNGLIYHYVDMARMSGNISLLTNEEFLELSKILLEHWSKK